MPTKIDEPKLYDERKRDTEGALLEEGVIYYVAFDDCCVAGEFTSRLAEITTTAEEDYEWTTLLLFENGVELTTMMATTFERREG